MYLLSEKIFVNLGQRDEEKGTKSLTSLNKFRIGDAENLKE